MAFANYINLTVNFFIVLRLMVKVLKVEMVLQNTDVNVYKRVYELRCDLIWSPKDLMKIKFKGPPLMYWQRKKNQNGFITIYEW